MGKYIVLIGAIIMFIMTFIGLFFDTSYSEGSYLYVFHIVYALLFLGYGIYLINKEKRLKKDQVR